MLEIEWYNNRSWFNFEGKRTLRIEDDEKLDPIERQVIESYDPAIADLIGNFLVDYRNKRCYRRYRIDPEKALQNDEKEHIDYVRKYCKHYKIGWDEGDCFSADNLRHIFTYMWGSRWFAECDEFDIVSDVFRDIYLSKEHTYNAEEYLFWSFRFCAWGGYENHLPYTLFKAITNRRFCQLSRSYSPELLDKFLCDVYLWDEFLDW